MKLKYVKKCYIQNFKELDTYHILIMKIFVHKLNFYNTIILEILYIKYIVVFNNFKNNEQGNNFVREISTLETPINKYRINKFT